jgi:three-Cys-motif partner protein
MSTDDFFEESTEQSRIKTRIVSKYFTARASVIVPRTRARGGHHVMFIDLFAGPGRYGDEVPSTPLRVLGSAVKDPGLRDMLVAIFNDVDTEHVHSLQKAIDSKPELEHLKNRPQLSNIRVGNELVEQLEGVRLVPTLLFVDPWGYKGLSLRLIGSVLKDWGSDCIIFFNFNRINSGLNNHMVREHMDALFGAERAEDLRRRIRFVKPFVRERAILEEIAEAFKDMGGRFFLSFRFWMEDKHRISHHLLFVSKNFRGYHIMKEIMAKESSSAPQGVPSFDYDPRHNPLHFEVTRPLEELEAQLPNGFAGRTLTMNEIYEEHSVGKPFLKNNYTQALWNLYERGVIETSRKPRKNTFADDISASFPAPQK